MYPLNSGFTNNHEIEVKHIIKSFFNMKGTQNKTNNHRINIHKNMKTNFITYIK